MSKADLKDLRKIVVFFIEKKITSVVISSIISNENGVSQLHTSPFVP